MHRFFGWLLLAGMFSTAGTSEARAPIPNADPKRGEVHGDPLPPGALARMGTTRLRHADKILTLLFLPDGTLASGSEDRTIRLWNADTGQELQRLEGQSGPVESLAVTPDGKLLACGSGYPESCIHLWDPVAAKHLRKFDTIKGVYHYSGLALSPDGKTLATASDEQMVRLWDVATGKARTFAQKMPARTVWFSPDGKYLFAQWSGELRLWETATGKEPDWFARRAWRQGSAVVTSDGKMLVVGAGSAVRWWDLPSAKELTRARWPAKFSLRSQVPVPRPAVPRADEDDLESGYEFGTFSPEGSLLARLDGGVVLRDSVTGDEVMKFADPVMRYDHLAFSRDSKRLALGGRAGVIRVLDLAKRAPLPEYGHQSSVHDVAFLLDGKVLASSSADGTVRLWDTATGKETRRFDGFVRGSVPLAATSDGKTLAVGDRVTISLRDAATGKELRQFAVPNGVSRLAFAPDGKTLAVEAGGTVRLLDRETGVERGQQMKHPDSIHALAFAPDGKTLAVGMNGGPICFWDAATGKHKMTIEKKVGTAASLAFAPDGKVLAVGYGDRLIRLWDPATGTELKELKGHDGWVNGLAFSPDGKRLVSSSSDRSIRVWETTDYRTVKELRGHASEVFGIAFSPDGKRLASSSRDTTALVWDVAR